MVFGNAAGDTPLSGPAGLTSTEAAARYAAGEYNRPPRPATKSLRAIVAGTLFSVFNCIIGSIVGFLLLFYLGTHDPRLLWDCAGVFSVAALNTVIAAVQEIRAKRAMDKVSMLVVRQVTVWRDGAPMAVDYDRIVRGDTIELKRGDQAVVDGPVLESNRLEMDESLLTGESEPVEKAAGDGILSGSFCLSGGGCYVAERLSGDSYAAGVTRTAQRLRSEPSPLQRSINGLVKMLFCTAGVLCVLQVALSLARHQMSVDLVRTVATILIGLVPQGLVLTSSVIFAIGIYRIGKAGAVIQSFNAVESFAGVQAICMDKTGTLTQNRMSVRKVIAADPALSLDALHNMLGTYALLSGEKNATIRALGEFAGDAGATLESEYPFSSRRKMSVIRVARGGQRVSYVLGALEPMMERCAPDARPSLSRAMQSERLDVYRNLLFGEVLDLEKIEVRPDDLGDFRVRPLCIVALSDVARPDAGEVVRNFAQSGIQCKILSGDSSDSILATCRDIGWDVQPADVITGAALDALDDAAFPAAVERSSVFARLKPEHKVRIVTALRKRGIHTAMIGDGVNDVPALRAANLGIAMDEGAEITREVADIILLRNRFTLLPEVFQEGRRIINTVGNVAKLFLTKNFVVIYLTLAAALLMLDFPLTPRRVSLFNIFAIGLPAMVIAFTNRGHERPRRFLLDLVSFVAVSALLIVCTGYAAYYLAPAFGAASEGGRAMAMVSAMVLTSIVNFLVVVGAQREGGRRRGYIAFAAGMVLVYAGMLSIGPDNAAMRFARTFYEISALDRNAWLAVLGACGAGSVALLLAHWLRATLVRRGE